VKHWWSNNGRRGRNGAGNGSGSVLIAILLRDNCSMMPTDFTGLSVPVYTVSYFKLCLCLLYVAYVLFPFASFSVCCCMTLGAAVCHASYYTNMQGLNWGISDPAPLIWDPLPLITHPVPHNWDPAHFRWNPPFGWVESKRQTLFKCHKSQTECLECSKAPGRRSGTPPLLSALQASRL